MESQWFNNVELQWFDSAEGQWVVFPIQDTPPAPYRIMLVEERENTNVLSTRASVFSLSARNDIVLADKATKRTILVGQPPLRVIVK